jgi:signal transduction histidine kinase
VDLLLPMDRLVDSMDESMVLLPPAQNDTSQSMVLWGNRVKEPANGARVASNDTTYTSNYSTVGHSTLVGDFDMEMMFVTDVLDSVFGTFRAIAEEHGVAFQVIVENEDEIPGVWGSPLCLQEAVTNVLDNAFKYAAIGKLDSPFSINPSPQVVVRIFPNINDQSGVSIEVRDNGPGIEKEEEERIFQRGYRGQATSSMVDGKGIGLDISRALMVRMGGKLQVATAHKQLEGTAMQFTLYRV